MCHSCARRERAIWQYQKQLQVLRDIYLQKLLHLTDEELLLCSKQAASLLDALSQLDTTFSLPEDAYHQFLQQAYLLGSILAQERLRRAMMSLQRLSRAKHFSSSDDVF
jgi:hypothetical protein